MVVLVIHVLALVCAMRPSCLILCVFTKKDKKSRAVTRKPRDAAALLFGLKFAGNIHYKFKSIAKLRKPGFRVPNIPAQTEFNAKWPFKIIQGDLFWSQ